MSNKVANFITNNLSKLSNKMKLAQNLDLKGKNHKVEDLETYRGPVDAQGD